MLSMTYYYYYGRNTNNTYRLVQICTCNHFRLEESGISNKCSIDQLISVPLNEVGTRYPSYWRQMILAGLYTAANFRYSV